jgi:thymidine kinase
MKGRLEVIAGPMFSGKTAELLRRLEVALIGHRSVVAFRPKLDDRVLENVVISRSGRAMAAKIVNPLDFREILDEAPTDQVVGIDEAQFFHHSVLRAVRALIQRGSRVIVTGLDLDYAEQPFGVMPELLALAETVDKVTAVCMVCDSLFATRTQRLLDGKPAPLGDRYVIDKFDKYAQSMGAGTVTYEARCLDCYVRPI